MLFNASTTREFVDSDINGLRTSEVWEENEQEVCFAECKASAVFFQCTITRPSKFG